MAWGKKWKPSKKAAREFAQQMDEINEFCAAHGIDSSRSNDSYYFTVDGQKYRVSNHTVERSNAKAYTEDGTQIRDVYHSGGRKDDTIYITASKTRIIEIYNDLQAGHKLDGRGRRVTA